MRSFYFGLNRTMCDVLNELRTQIEVVCYHNKRERMIFLSLVEEMQIMGNRMEAGLGDKQDVQEMAEHIKNLKKEVRELEAKRDTLEKENEDPGLSKNKGINRRN